MWKSVDNQIKWIIRNIAPFFPFNLKKLHDFPFGNKLSFTMHRTICSGGKNVKVWYLYNKSTCNTNITWKHEYVASNLRHMYILYIVKVMAEHNTKRAILQRLVCHRFIRFILGGNLRRNYSVYLNNCVFIRWNYKWLWCTNIRTWAVRRHHLSCTRKRCISFGCSSLVGSVRSGWLETKLPDTQHIVSH